jgi:transposase
MVIGGSRRFFTDERWALVAPFVEQVMRRGPKGNARRFLEAIAWILRSGAPWRDLAKDLGPWERVYRRYRRWALAGTWERLRRALSLTTAFRFLLVDSTIVKAHPHAAGALKGAGRQVLGRSRGGFTTKLHAVVTERGELVRYVVTGGEVADITQARGLVRHRSSAVLGDRAYDSNACLAHVEALGAKAVIPSRRNRREPRELDTALYSQRNVIERWFGRLKVFRRVATRYEKTAISYLGVVAASAWLVAITGWAG